MIQKDKLHQTEEGFIKCLSLKANLNKGQNNTLKTLYPLIMPVPRPIVKQPEKINPNWLSGFTAGDGSFMIIIRKHINCVTGYQVQAAFNIGQHSKDAKQLNKIKDFQGCGNVYVQKTDGRIVVRKFNDIIRYIKPHFEKYPLRNKKQKDFIIWCKIITMIENNEHKTNEGLNEIKKIRENMN